MLAEIGLLLQKTIGLDADSVGPSLIEHAVRARMSAGRHVDIAAYWAHLNNVPAEMQDLIDAVIVPETWFFRDGGAFTTMAQLLFEGRSGLRRLLSLPCSTGEEPYSMAMAMLDAGFGLDDFQIDAIDVSTRAIAAAEQAVYGQNAFRTADLSFRDRHFEAVPGGFRPLDPVRRRVRLLQGNLLDPGLLLGSGVYDVIFCRNVLIYFNRATQDRVLGVLTRFLAPNGLLFVGPSETSLPPRRDFAVVKLAKAFVFRRTEPRPAGPKALPVARPALPAAPRRPAARPAAPAPAPVRALPDLQEVRRLADLGRLAEAADHCEAHLLSGGPSAEPFYLLGLIRDATGRKDDAAAFYRKAIYLDPAHQEALAQLALLLAQQGDTVGAKALNDRVRRLAERNGA